MIDRGRGVDLTGRVLRLAKDQQLTLLAAGVAFYGFLSLVPLMLLALGLAASVGGEALANRLSAAATDILTVQAQTLLADAVTDETGRRGATVVGILGLLWGSSRVLRGLDRAFSQVYDTVGEKSLLDTIWDAMIVSIAIAAGLALLGALELVVRFLPGLEVSFAVAVVGQLFVVLGLFVTFLPLYVIFPDANVGIREAAPGTVIAAVGWFVLSRTFSLYAGLLSDYAVYGALGAVFLVLVWLYVGAIILVFAAVVNAVLADRELDRQLQSPGRRQIPTEAMTDDATGADEGATEDRASDRARESSASARTRDRADDPAALREEIERLRDRVDDFESDVEERTVRKESLEGELKRYVRRRVRRGHARDWGPYLVLLYGTAMSIGAFYFLNGGWAILAMLVVWTSTLGLYVLMVLIGFGISLLGLPGRLRDAVGDRR
ncbi:YihY family inner membrane protein [Natrinema thermotolerans]|uniref:YihY family inner membrane protein n=1 Tax=Natrinema thermotolerans TaxID=121872 RepID=A0AAF0PA57_9EURY|nr:YihY/virulence factor BrkB family protein [Natrinema thermotolerans]QCC59777.1 YihY family inner membrane protein [Natrinema thermotolerans]WMT06764.1 YihY family inner membrane protein [Natrinema thermotolerans]